MNDIITYEKLLKVLKTYMSEDYISLIDKYYKKAKEVYKEKKRITGEEYITHSVSVAYTLADLKMDPITIGSALVHEAITLDKCSYEEIESEFGKETATILACCAKMSSLKGTFNIQNNVDKYRRIVVGLSENPAALFIKLADRLNNLKTLDVHDALHQKNVVDETMGVYIPIAHRLGIKKIKSELEDLCLKISDPSMYQEILDKINADKSELEESLLKMKEEIINILKEHEINFEILSRVKSVRGIYNKLASGRKWNDIYDLLGLRVIVEKTEECYLVIGLIHSKFKPIPNRFKDYIACPKNNMYQSVHTTVFGVDGRIYEVQVRTYEMDEIAEKGVASHWSYKERTGMKKDVLAEKLENFKTLIEVNNIENNMDFFKNLNTNLNKDQIYVFTPKGDVIELPINSTPIDFAYKIHSEVGDSVVSALVNNKIVKLDYTLNDSDIVELKTQVGKGPNKAWLKFVKTEQAKSRIKSYFYKKEKEKLLNIGKELISSEIRKRNRNINDVLTEKNIYDCIMFFKVKDIDDIYLGVSTFKFTPASVVNKLTNYDEKKEETIKQIIKENNRKNNIIVAGTKNILTSIASCCLPIYGEKIIGYVTKSNGISIHRMDCGKVNKESKRIINVTWSEVNEFKYETYLLLTISNNEDHLTDFIAIATKYEINITSFIFKKNVKGNNQFEMICKVKDINVLYKFIENLVKLKYVSKVEREIKL